MQDFPDEVLTLIKEKPNICKQLHLPAQAGNSRILVSIFYFKLIDFWFNMDLHLLVPKASYICQEDCLGEST